MEFVEFYKIIAQDIFPDNKLILSIENLYSQLNRQNLTIKEVENYRTAFLEGISYDGKLAIITTTEKQKMPSKPRQIKIT